MYDRERDYNWIHDTSNATTLSTVENRDKVSITALSSLIESSDGNRKVRLGQTTSEWNGSVDKKCFPQLVKLATDMTSVSVSNSN